MGNSWTKRHSHEEDLDAIRRKRSRYNSWKKSWLDAKGNWMDVPLKVGDSWNPRLNCWNNEVYRGERYPGGHDMQGELTEKGKSIQQGRGRNPSLDHSTTSDKMQAVRA